MACSLASAEPLPQTIKVYSEAWIDSTNKDGTGYYWDILREVFEQSGSTLSINTTTYKRSVGMVQTGEADLMVGAFVFADNERGKLLQKAFDRRFEEMLKSGELKTLNEKWKWNVYPFN